MSRSRKLCARTFRWPRMAFLVRASLHRNFCEAIFELVRLERPAAVLSIWSRSARSAHTGVDPPCSIRQGRSAAGNVDGIRLAPTFIGNIVDVILASAASSWTGTVNVATPETLSIRQIANVIGAQLGIEPKFEIV